MTLTIYGDLVSGNCLKVKWVADYLGVAYRWIDVDVVKGGARTPGFLDLHPDGQVPAVVLPDGRALAQSNAIIFHLAEGTDLIPADPYDRAVMLKWQFWEQYSHEPYIAVARFQVKYLVKPAASLDPKLVERGYAALGRLEGATAASDYLAGDRLTLADVSLVAYTRVADEGGFDLGSYPAVRTWIARVEQALGLAGR
ncbi:MAG: glutathione S-transferase [Caulobacteraceae bacterium]|nr:glutathione S-transferase [Caulobacteraceae bacterium]